MKPETKKMFLNILSTAMGVALGFGIYKAIDKQMTKNSGS